MQYNYDPVKMTMPGMMQQGFQMVQQFVADPLYGVKTVRFTQHPDWVECLCPCFGETSNIYQITSTDPLGHVTEKSGCCSKFWCQQWRAFDLTMQSTQNQELFRSKREYKIPAVFCCPCSRPIIQVESNGKFIGSVSQPYFFCGRSENFNKRCPFPLLEEIDILDEMGQCCQIGVIARVYMCCRCCGPCQFINFDIYTPDKQKVGRIQNVYNGFCLECCSKADKFVLTFPDQATYNDKILLINAALTIDYDIFEYTCGNLA